MIESEEAGESQVIPDRIVQINEALGGEVERRIDSRGNPEFYITFGDNQILTDVIPKLGKPPGVVACILYAGPFYDGSCTMLQMYAHRVETDVKYGRVVFANQIGQKMEVDRTGRMRFTEGKFHDFGSFL